MKDWRMIHKIKAMYDEGQGSSIRSISRELGVSRNTVKKYLKMSGEEIAYHLNRKERIKILDQYRDHVIQLLKKYPGLSAVKIMRKLKGQGLDLTISDRSMRRYVHKLKETVVVRQKRYYEPVLDMIPGVQCQVDLGEIRNVRVGEALTTVYFTVFVLSYSRKLFAVLSASPINTESFIRMHDEAFTFFEGMPEECVYDQTKLVVIKEAYREVLFNELFYQYATTAGFDARVCRGYDPESKGRVEAGVKYIKQDFFYGDTFTSFAEMEKQFRDWIIKVANQRIHGTTHEKPEVVWQTREQPKLKPYLKPAMELFHPKGIFRKVDKTSLLSFKSVKYSVPMLFQSSKVIVEEQGSLLLIYAPETGEEIARHTISHEKGKTIKNNNHYRDYNKDITSFEFSIAELVGEPLARSLCYRLKREFPKNYKDQLVGLKKTLSAYRIKTDLSIPIGHICDRPGLRVSFIRDYLEAYYCTSRDKVEDFEQLGSYLTGDLSPYARLTASTAGR